jgi:hypothetical protein
MNKMGQFSGGSFISPQGQMTQMNMMPFGFGGFMMQQVPIVTGPVAYYPAPSEIRKNKKSYGATGHPFGNGRGGATGGPF